jgi:hypothetical protein
MKITTKIHSIILFIIISSSQSIAQWVLNNHSFNNTVNCIASDASLVFAGFEGDDDNVIVSADYGDFWSDYAFQPHNHVRAIALYSYGVGRKPFIGTWGYGIYRIDSKLGMINDNKGLKNLYVTTIFVPPIMGQTGRNDTIVLSGTWGGGVFISCDVGCNWKDINSGITNLYVRSLLIDVQNYFVGTLNGLFRSSNSGSAWTPINEGLINTTVTALAKSGTYLFVGTSSGGIFRSTNNGDNWVAVNAGLNNLDIAAFAVSPVSGSTIIFAATWGGGVYYSDNNGEEWIAANEGMTGNLVRSLAANNQSLFAGNDDGTIWRRPLSDFATTDVRSNDNQITPKDFSLFQNYPNPFNPTTTIGYQVPVAGNVQIVVHDLLGREVSILLNERKSPGSYNVIWDGSHFSSGIYICRMTAAGQSVYRKMILMK